MQRSWFLALGVGVIMFWGSKSASADFATATRPPFSPEGGKSVNGIDLSTVKTKVQPIWDAIVFEKDGKPVEYIATIETDAGTMKAKFYPDVAPNHARNFIALSKIGFYDGLKFHRVVPEFMIQGGCPKGNGTGGPGYCVKQEFNKKPHKKGVLSMARSSNVDSAGCQFFVCHGNPSFLDNQYTAFGELVEGHDVLDKIATAPRSGQETPATPVVIKKITISGGE